MNAHETRIHSVVEDEMQEASERGFLVAVTQRDGDHVEVDIERSESDTEPKPWLRFYVSPSASEEEVRRQIRAALAGEGDLRK
jgi:hypothetical protein